MAVKRHFAGRRQFATKEGCPMAKQTPPLPPNAPAEHKSAESSGKQHPPPWRTEGSQSRELGG